MLNELPNTFTDRREALALFDRVRWRDPDEPWPLLPLIAFIGAGGSGKSRLIEYIRDTKCRFADGRSTLPHTFIDFTSSTSPKNLLDILITLRNQLQGQVDGDGKHLTFPRFDLGASVVAAFANESTLPLLDDEKIKKSLDQTQQLFTTIADIGSLLGGVLPVIPSLVSVLKLATSATKVAELPQLQTIMRQLESGPGWKWYREHGSDTGLLAADGAGKVLLRLHALSTPGTNERDKLIGKLLPMAFIDDLHDALTGPDAPKAWSKTANVVVFLDSYEALLKISKDLGAQLLNLLVCSEQRRRGKTDPLLVIVGSRDRLLKQDDMGQDDEQHVPFERRALSTKEDAKRWAETRYSEIVQHLPLEPSVLRLDDLYIPLVLLDFGMEDTRNLLSQLAKERQRRIVKERQLNLEEVFVGETGEQLVQAIQSGTQGHPLYVNLAAEAIFEAKIRGNPLTSDQFDRLLVSSERAPNRQTTGEYLLALFLRQLSEEERKQLTFCSAPRALNIEILKTILHLPTAYDAQECWNQYHHYTFFHLRDSSRLVLHPVVRTLLLKRLLPRDYTDIHTRLRKHFSAEAQQGNEEARIEEVYHALTLGDPELAIECGIKAQQSNIARWAPLLEAVAQAPTSLMPLGVEQQAYDSLVLAEQQHNVKDNITALILYLWLLTAAHGDSYKAAHIQANLGHAYSLLSTGDRATNLLQAIACFQEALRFWTPATTPSEYAAVQTHLGRAYSQLPTGDRATNILQAISCFKESLRFRTPEAAPFDYASTQNNLGRAYSQLSTGDRTANLGRAIACLQEALRFWTPETAPFDYASTQNNLGRAYSQLPTGDGTVNLGRAIACLQEALRFWTPETAPFDYADTQTNLGCAYSQLSTGDRTANLVHAIACFREALRFQTPETAPFEYATIQNNLGIACSQLSTDDRTANMDQAIKCFQEALRFWTPETAPYECRMANRNLADLHFAQREWVASLSAYHAGMDVGEQLYHVSLSAESRVTEVSENSTLYRHAAFAAARCDETAQALLILERGRARLLAEALRLRVSRPAGVPDEVWIAFERAGATVRATQEIRSPMPGEEPNLSLAYAAREQAVREANASLDAAIEGVRIYASNFLHELDLSAIQALLPDEHTALVSFCITEQGSICFVVDHNHGQSLRVVDIPTFTQADLLRLLIERDADGSLVGGWLGAYHRYLLEHTLTAINVWQETITKTLAVLGQQLVAPLLSQLPSDVEQIIFLPSAELFLLPLHAVPLSGNDLTLVCDHYQVSYVPSIEVLAYTRAKVLEAAVTPELYAVINPQADPYLLFTSIEGRAITELFANHVVDEGLAATKQGVIAKMQGRTYVHFSCHGYYDWNDPMMSGLELADGPLTLAELQHWEVDLSTVRLITLSSAESGITDVMQGSPDEYVGLPAGFMLAGAPCVVSSLWAITDLSAAILMERFYRNHLNGGMSFAAALREAQVWVRELKVGEVAEYVEQCYRQAQQKEKTQLFRLMRYYRHLAEQNPALRPFAHPYYWAGFTVNGL